MTFGFICFLLLWVVVVQPSLLTCLPDPKNYRHRGQEKNTLLVGVQTPICPNPNLPPHKPPANSYNKKLPRITNSSHIYIFDFIFIFFLLQKEKKKPQPLLQRHHLMEGFCQGELSIQYFLWTKLKIHRHKQNPIKNKKGERTLQSIAYNYALSSKSIGASVKSHQMRIVWLTFKMKEKETNVGSKKKPTKNPIK